MTRSHEEVTVRNIFLSKFLERLREIEREPAQRSLATPVPVQVHVEAASVPVPVIVATAQVEAEQEKSVAQQDEFLGVLEPDNLSEERPSYANECIPECEDEIAEMMADERNTETSSAAGPENATKATDENSSIPDEEPLASEQQIKSVVLYEQEPYNFDSCTITAVLQLLPEVDGVRNLVLSVRSHTFTPQIILSNIAAEDIQTGLSVRILDAFQQYRTALPELAAEKLKKAKPSKAKRTSKQTETKTHNPKEAELTDSGAGSSQVVPEQPKEQRNLFTSETKS